MSTAHELAQECLNRSALQSKQYYNKKVNPQRFEPGDVVLVYCPRKRKNCYPKWQRPFAEEASVVSRVNDITYIVKPVKSRKNRVVHVDKLRLLSRPACEQSALFNSPL